MPSNLKLHMRLLPIFKHIFWHNSLDYLHVKYEVSDVRWSFPWQIVLLYNTTCNSNKAMWSIIASSVTCWWRSHTWCDEKNGLFCVILWNYVLVKQNKCCYNIPVRLVSHLVSHKGSSGLFPEVELRTSPSSL